MLDQALSDPRSHVMQFLGVHCNLDAVSTVVNRLHVQLGSVPELTLVQRRAFEYMIRWRYEPYQPMNTFGWINASRMGCQEEYARLVWRGNFHAGQRVACALAMASMEVGQEIARNDLAELESVMRDTPLLNHRQRLIWHPTFELSDHVGGADASMIVDNALVEFVTEPFNAQDLFRAIVHLILDRQDTWGIRRVIWLSPVSSAVYPVEALTRKLPLLRELFPKYVTPVQRYTPFNPHDPAALPFYHHDLLVRGLTHVSETN